MPTVQQVWRQALPAETELVAGESGLYEEVSWVVSLKPTPPGFQSIRGREFALVDAGAAEKLGVSLPALVSSLAERKVSATAILGDIVPDLKAQADRADMCLFRLPRGCNILSLEADMARLISEERSHLYNREYELSNALMDVALSGKGTGVILERLRRLTGRSIMLLDAAFQPRSDAPPEALSEVSNAAKLIVERLERSSSTPQVAGLRLGPEHACFAGLLTLGRATGGYLVLLGTAGELGGADRLAVKVGTLALTVEMSRRQAVEETEDRFQTEIMESLLAGDFSSSQVMAERARRLGLDFSVPYVALAVQSPEPHKLEDLAGKAASTLRTARCHLHQGALVVLHPSPDATVSGMRHLGAEIARQLSAGDGPVSLGLGRPYTGAEGVHISFQEALRALTMGRQLFGDGAVVYFGDLGIYRLLFSSEKSELKTFCEEHLGQLAEYDRKNAGELLRTLEVFLKCNNISETARRLHVHRNTLLYRLNRIQEISAIDLEDGETRLALHLALRALQVIQSA
ncbi:MAG: helix-turn-helix domain-containing protein [Chloroflexi bacterium]|nr:helix-turn-helix domain-containing protein [Chloroflexota bacterium]